MVVHASNVVAGVCVGLIACSSAQEDPAGPRGISLDADKPGPQVNDMPAAFDADNAADESPAPAAILVDAGASGFESDMDDDCGEFRAESQFERPPIDVIWAVDNSPSMLPLFAAVAAGLADFAASVEASGADMRVVMISALVSTLPPEVQQDQDRFLLRLVDVASTNAFEILLLDYPNYGAFLRPNAATHVIVVSDFINTLPRATFRTEMESNLGHEFTFHAIAEPLTGADYYALAMETGGVMVPIVSDWSVVFDQLETAVVETAKLPCEVPLVVESGADLDNVQVLYTDEQGTSAQLLKAGTASQCGVAQAWHFDEGDNPSMIFLCPAACDSVREQSGSLDVVVGCEPPPVVL